MNDVWQRFLSFSLSISRIQSKNPPSSTTISLQGSLCRSVCGFGLHKSVLTVSFLPLTKLSSPHHISLLASLFRAQEKNGPEMFFLSLFFYPSTFMGDSHTAALATKYLDGRENHKRARKGFFIVNFLLGTKLIPKMVNLNYCTLRFTVPIVIGLSS